LPLADIKFFTAGMYTIEFTRGVLLVKLAITLHCRTAIGTAFNDSEFVEYSATIRRSMRL
jgi:hypothetical protein